MYNKITTVVVGTGFIGPVHAEALMRLGVLVKGMLGSTLEKSEDACSKLGLGKAYVNFEEVLNDPEVDVIHIAVPNIFHYDMVKQAIAAGKHVLCEKPLAMNSKESSELVQLSKEANNILTAVAYNIRFYPLNIEVRNKIRQLGKGNIFSVVGSYVQDWLMYNDDFNWRILSEKGGALRAIADIGTHWIDLITFMTGLEVEAVFADLSIVHETRHRPKGEIATFTGGKSGEQETEAIKVDTEDCGSILFRFKGGSKGQLWVSQVGAGRKNCLQYDISTNENSFQWNSEVPNELQIGYRNRPNELLRKDPSLMSSETNTYVNYPGGHNEGFPDTFKQCFKAFYDAIMNDGKSLEPLFANFEEGHKEVVICEAIMKSHHEERWIKLP